MGFWFFRKKDDKTHEHIERINNNLHHSFSNIKEDIHKIGKWIDHFNTRHSDYDKQFKMLHVRVREIEEILDEINRKTDKDVKVSQQNSVFIQKFSEIEENNEPPFFSNSIWDSLTETQQKICWKLALLQKEMPDQWISLKYLAREIYPDKDYSQVRSTLSQFIASLEELGYVKRRRKGKNAYIYSTKDNPGYEKNQLLVKKLRVKKQKGPKEV